MTSLIGVFLKGIQKNPALLLVCSYLVKRPTALPPLQSYSYYFANGQPVRKHLTGFCTGLASQCCSKGLTTCTVHVGPNIVYVRELQHLLNS